MLTDTLNSDIQYLPGVGPKRAALLRSELGVTTVGDLLRVYPFRYIDRSSVQRIADVQPDSAFIQVQARVVSATLMAQGGRIVYMRSTSGAVRGDGTIPGYNGATPSLKEIKYNTVKRLSVLVDDGSGQMEMVFFNFF